MHLDHLETYPQRHTHNAAVARPEGTRRALRIGLGGPVGSGKTATVAALCRLLRDRVSIAVVTNDIYTREDAAFLLRNAVLPPEAMYDLMVVSTGTRRVWPLKAPGPLTDEYSMTSDWGNQWLTGGLEPDVIAEAHLDATSIFNGIQRFAKERDHRLARQRNLMSQL